MEDRTNAGLWLEMTDLGADEYERRRVPELLAHEGVERASWWANCRRDRDDLPRVLEEFDLLGLFEVDATFRAPSPPDGITGFHFVRTPRPGQGVLSARSTLGLSFVLISPREPDQAQALRDWGDFVHIHEIAATAVPGITMITPYENRSGGDPRFLHLYEMDSPDPEATFKSMTPLVTERIGPPDSQRWRSWANCPELRIMYVNSFALLGTAAPGAPTT